MRRATRGGLALDRPCYGSKFPLTTFEIVLTILQRILGVLLVQTLCVAGLPHMFLPLASAQSTPIPVGNTGTGTVRGTVIYQADPQRPWRLGRYYIKDAKAGRLAEAVVALTDRDLPTSPPAPLPATLTVDQKDFQFTPETSAIRAGDQVRFLNSDNHTHNVKTAHPRYSFNVTMPVDSAHVEKFEFAGGLNQPYQIDCALHSAMRAWIYVFDHPWYFVTGTDGRFELQQVPPGKYRLEVAHPAGGLRQRASVEVVAGQTVEIELRLDPPAPR